MDRRYLSGPLLLLLALAWCVTAPAQTTTSTRSSSSRSSGSSSFGGIGSSSGADSNNNRQGQVGDFIVAIIGGLMRHPDPRIRMQAVESVISGLASGSGNSNNSNNSNNSGNVMSLLAPSGNTTSGSNSTDGGTGSTGLGAVIFIPDLYVLLADPDPEVKDIASIGLDAIFGTDMTLLKMMDDPETTIRRYATKVYAMRSFSGQNRTNNNNNSGNNNNNGSSSNVYELMALRTLLVKLKYEKDVEVRKSITDALDWYIVSGGSNNNNNTGGSNANRTIGNIFGSSQKMFQYLQDENPEVRKNAVKMLTVSDTGENMIEIFFKMLKTEQNEEVKAAIQEGITKLIEDKQAESQDRLRQQQR